MEFKRATRTFLTILLNRQYVYSDESFTYINANGVFIKNAISTIEELSNDCTIQSNLLEEAKRLTSQH